MKMETLHALQRYRTSSSSTLRRCTCVGSSPDRQIQNIYQLVYKLQTTFSSFSLIVITRNDCLCWTGRSKIFITSSTKVTQNFHHFRTGRSKISSWSPRQQEIHNIFIILVDFNISQAMIVFAASIYR